MRKILMAASAALLASTMGVFAQESGGGTAEPEIKKMEEGAAGSASGGVQADVDASGTASTTKQPDAAAGATGEAQVDTEAGGQATTEKQPRLQGDATGEAQIETNASGEATTQKQPDANAETQADTSASGEATKQDDTAAGANTSGETTASINLTAEQQTEVRTVFQEVQVEPANIDIEVNIGTVAPETVVLHPLPARIIEIVPAYRTYKYFVLADGTIVIVVPETRKVVYVITA